MSHNLTTKNLFLISGLNLSSLSLKPLPLVLSLQALGEFPIWQINVCDFDKQGGNSRKLKESVGAQQSMKKLSKIWNTFSAFTILFSLDPPTTSLRCGHGKASEHRKKQWGTKKKKITATRKYMNIHSNCVDSLLSHSSPEQYYLSIAVLLHSKFYKTQK